MSSPARRQLRYWCFRMANEAAGGASADGVPSGLLDVITNSPAFQFTGGWASFAVKWDISQDEPFKIVPLDKSLVDEWDEYCRSVAKDVPAELISAIETNQAIDKKRKKLRDVIYDFDISADGSVSKEVRYGD